MTALITPAKARAYVNHSRWIAECPMECGCARVLQRQETMFHCSECGALTQVEWPANADEIWEALQERPLPRTRNWFPEEHHLALKCGAPHGQTPKELREEQRENEGG